MVLRPPGSAHIRLTHVAHSTGPPPTQPTPTPHQTSANREKVTRPGLTNDSPYQARRGSLGRVAEPCLPRIAGRTTLFPAERTKQGRSLSALLSGETRCVSRPSRRWTHRRRREARVWRGAGQWAGESSCPALAPARASRSHGSERRRVDMLPRLASTVGSDCSSIRTGAAYAARHASSSASGSCSSSNAQLWRWTPARPWGCGSERPRLDTVAFPRKRQRDVRDRE